MNKIESNINLKIKINEFLNLHYNKIIQDKINIDNYRKKILNLNYIKDRKINQIYEKYKNQLNLIHKLLEEDNNKKIIYNYKNSQNHFIKLKNDLYKKKINYLKKESNDLNIKIKESEIFNNLEMLNNNINLDKIKKENSYFIELKKKEIIDNINKKEDKLELIKENNGKKINHNSININKLKQKLKTINNKLQVQNILQNIDFFEEENLFLENNLIVELEKIKNNYLIINNNLNLEINKSNDFLKNSIIKNNFKSVLLEIPVKIMKIKKNKIDDKIKFLLQKIKKIINNDFHNNNLNIEIKHYKNKIEKEYNLINYIHNYYEKLINKYEIIIKKLEIKNINNENKLFESLLFNIINNNLNIKILVKKNRLL